MEAEIWVNIEGGLGFYQISSFGNIRSVDRVIKRGERLVNKKGVLLKWNAPAKARDGHISLTIFRNSNCPSKNIYCHRQVAIHFVPNPDNKPEVNHKDGDKSNNHFSNLEWNTRIENMQHSMRLGLNDSRGEKCGMSKLTTRQVLEIRSFFVPKFGEYSRLARIYKVSANNIRDIIKRETWKHI